MWSKVYPSGDGNGNAQQQQEKKDFDINNFMAEIDEDVRKVVGAGKFDLGLSSNSKGNSKDNNRVEVSYANGGPSNNYSDVGRPLNQGYERGSSQDGSTSHNDYYNNGNNNNYKNNDNSNNSSSNNNYKPIDYDAPFSNGKRDQDDEVKFNFESESGIKNLVHDLKSNIDSLSGQIDEFKSRLSKASDRIREVETAKVELEESKADIEEENKLLQSIVAKGGVGDSSMMMGQKSFAGNRQGGMIGNRQDQSVGMMLNEDNIRKALMGDDDEAEQDIGGEGDGKTELKLIDKLKEWLLNFVPFRDQIRKIQSRFGSSVSSYFRFYRFLFIQYSIMTIFCSAFLVYHAKNIYDNDQISQFYTSYGILPNFMMFSSFNSTENLYYVVCLVFGMVFLFVTTVDKLLREEKNTLELDQLEMDNDIPYSKDILCAWDFSICRQFDVVDAQGSLTQNYLQLLETTKTKGVTLQRTKLQRFSLFLRRFLGFLLYLILQCSSFAVIIYLTIKAVSISDELKSIPVLKNFSTFIVPALINAIGAITPPLLKVITSLERWDLPETQVNVTLFRIFLSAQLNILSVFFGYLLLVDPMLLSTTSLWPYRLALTLAPSSNYICSFDQASDGLFSLVVSNYVINIVANLASSLFPVLLEKFFNITGKREEFNIATKIVELLVSVSYVLASFPFAPLSILFMPMYLLIDFKFNYYCVNSFFMKPKRPWKASKAGSVFTSFYLFSIFMVLIPIAVYFLASQTFPKDCDLQDAAIGLCTDSNLQACSLDTSSEYYQYFNNIKINYPGDICDNKCGAFVHNSDAFEPITVLVSSYFVVDYIWSILFTYPYLPWAIVTVLGIFLYRKGQASKILDEMHATREKRLEGTVSNLVLEKRKLQKLIDKLKSLDKGSAENQPDDALGDGNIIKTS